VSRHGMRPLQAYATGLLRVHGAVGIRIAALKSCWTCSSGIPAVVVESRYEQMQREVE
jgi:hypothetical protein